MTVSVTLDGQTFVDTVPNTQESIASNGNVTLTAPQGGFGNDVLTLNTNGTDNFVLGQDTLSFTGGILETLVPVNNTLDFDIDSPVSNESVDIVWNPTTGQAVLNVSGPQSFSESLGQINPGDSLTVSSTGITEVYADKSSVNAIIDEVGGTWKDIITSYNSSNVKTEIRYDNNDGSSVTDYYAPANGDALNQQDVVNADKSTTNTTFNVSGTGTWKDIALSYNSAGVKTEAEYDNNDGSSVTDYYTPASADALNQQDIVNADKSSVDKTFDVAGGTWKDIIITSNTAGVKTEAEYDNNDGSSTIDYYTPASADALNQQDVLNADKSSVDTTYNVSGTGTWKDYALSYNAAGVKTEAVYANNDGSSVTDYYTPASADALNQQDIVNADKSTVDKTFDVAGGTWKDIIISTNTAGVKTEAEYDNNDGSSTTDYYTPASADALNQQDIVNTDKSSVDTTYNVSGTGTWKDYALSYNAAGVKTEAVYANNDGSSVTDYYTPASADALNQQDIVNADKSSVDKTFDVAGGTWKDIITSYNTAGVKTEAEYDNNDGSSITDYYAPASADALNQQDNVNADKSSVDTTFNVSGTGTWKDIITSYNTAGVKTEAEYDNNDGSSVTDYYTPASADALNQQDIVNADKSSVDKTFDVAGGTWKDIIITSNTAGVKTEAEYDNNDGSSTTDYYTPASADALNQQDIVNADKSSVKTTFNVSGTGTWKDYALSYNSTGVETEAQYVNNDGSSVTDYFDPTHSDAMNQQDIVNADKSTVDKTFDVAGGTWKDIITSDNTAGAQVEVEYDNNDGSSTTDYYSPAYNGALNQQDIVNADKSSVDTSYNVTGTGTWKNFALSYNSAGAETEAVYNNNDGSSVTDYFDPTHSDAMNQQDVVNADKSSVDKTFDVVGSTWKDIITSYNTAGVKTEAEYDNNDGSSVTDYYDPTHSDALNQQDSVNADKSSVKTTFNVSGTGTWKDIVLSDNSAGVETQARYDNNDGSFVADYYNPANGDALFGQEIVAANNTGTIAWGSNTIGFMPDVGANQVSSGAVANTVDIGGSGTEQVSGFSALDKIDLTSVTFGAQTTLAFSEDASNNFGTLTVSDGTHTTSVQLLGQYMASGFSKATDAGAGTLVSYTQPVAQTLALAANVK